MNKFLFTLLVFIVVSVVVGPFFLPHGPLDINLEERLQRPFSSHILGTDNQGRCILSRLVYGGRISLAIGFIATVVSLLIGLAIGIFCGYKGGIKDHIFCMLIDITLSFPSLLLAIGITVILPPGMLTIVLALTLLGWSGFARFTRGIVIALRKSGYIESAEVLGTGPFIIMFRHILPNCLPKVLVTGFLKLGAFILTESGLSFLGLGVPPPVPTWGGMINYGMEFIEIAPWIVIFPGLTLSLVVIICNVLGDRIMDRMNPGYRKAYEFSKAG